MTRMTLIASLMQVHGRVAWLDPPPLNSAGNCKFLNEATYLKVLTRIAEAVTA